MRVSIVTVCFNSEKTIKATLDSIRQQAYPNIEVIVIDGDSSDLTNEIVKASGIANKHIIEPDDGIYDAMNKGIAQATGDIIGILNSDDILSNPEVITEIVKEIDGFDAVYSDVGFYNQNFTHKVRKYSSSNVNLERFSRGFMPAHPSFYIRKEALNCVGGYNLNYTIAADFDFLLRFFLKGTLKSKYVVAEWVKMRVGGVSTSGLKGNYIINKEMLESCKSNGVKSSWAKMLSKYPEKLVGYIRKL